MVLHYSLVERAGDRETPAVPPTQVTSQHCVPPPLSVWHLGTFLKRPTRGSTVCVCACVFDCRVKMDRRAVLAEQD